MKAIFETRFARVGEASAHYCSKVNSTTDLTQWAINSLDGYFADRCDQEEFLIAILDTKNVVRQVVRITRGLLDASLVHPREVFRAAVHAAASRIVLIHNHPSGDPKPSPQDLSVTERLCKAGELLGIPVLDHVIVGNGQAVTLRELHLFPA